MNRKYLAGACLIVFGFVGGCSSDEDRLTVASSPSVTSSTSTANTTTRESEPEPDTGTMTRPPVSSQTVAAPPVESSSSTCPDSGWTTLDDPGTQQMVIGDVYDVRPVPTQCHDVVFFDINTTEDVGFFAYYTDTGDGIQDGSANQIEVEGPAAIQIAVYAPVANYDLFVGYGFNPDPDWTALREVKFAGSFEGVTSFVIGVDHKSPFAVEREHANGGTQIVVRIAH